jgi:hypothetical protein
MSRLRDHSSSPRGHEHLASTMRAELVRKEHCHRMRRNTIGFARDQGRLLPVNDIVRRLQRGVDPAAPWILAARRWQFELKRVSAAFVGSFVNREMNSSPSSKVDAYCMLKISNASVESTRSRRINWTHELGVPASLSARMMPAMNSINRLSVWSCVSVVLTSSWRATSQTDRNRRAMFEPTNSAAAP